MPERARSSNARGGAQSASRIHRARGEAAETEAQLERVAADALVARDMALRAKAEASFARHALTIVVIGLSCAMAWLYAYGDM